MGVLVGLAAPPLLAATAVGAVAGGLIGRFVVRVTFRVDGGEGLVKEWRLGEMVTVVRGP